jgi:hypothetical protein
MRKTLLEFVVLALCSTFVHAKEPSKPANFSGNWVLNFSQTKNPPPGLENYSMVVEQDQQQLKVETSLQGDLQPTQNRPNSGGYPRGSSGGGYPGRRGGIGVGMGRVGIGMPGGGMGMPGGRGSGGPRGESRPEENVAAYELYPQSTVYKLDGSESTAQLGDPAQTNATAKAEWAKNGGVLKLSLEGNADSSRRGGKIQIKDQWKLSEDGKFLRVDRSIKSPGESGTAHLVFFRKEDRASSPAAPEP